MCRTGIRRQRLKIGAKSREVKGTTRFQHYIYRKKNIKIFIIIQILTRL